MRWMPLIAVMLLACGCRSATPESVRFATFNSALSRQSPGALKTAMQSGTDEQAKAVAAIVQAARPDVLVLQEFDYDETGESLRLFQQKYLAIPQAHGLQAVGYDHVYLPPSNTGLPTGVDLNNDGLVAPCPGAEIGTPAYAADCHGWGLFPGQYAFAVLSKYPIDEAGIRTFQEFLWKDLPGNHIPPGYYSDKALAVLRLSSKNHVDVPIVVGGETPIHVLAAHPTPPVFDGPEDRNGRRNADEVALSDPYAFYGHDENGATGLRDDRGQIARPYHMVSALQRANLKNFWLFIVFPPMVLAETLAFRPTIVMGDMNLDPADGDSSGRVNVLKSSIGSRFREMPTPQSAGGVAAAERQGGVNASHAGDPAADTADWDDSPGGPGNLRVDYVLPSSDLEVLGGGVFWPTADGPLMGVDLATVKRASDHRLVWVDVRPR